MTETMFGLETEQVAFALDVATNGWALDDKRAGVRWGSEGESWVTLIANEERMPLTLDSVEVVEAGAFGNPVGFDGGLRAKFADTGGRIALTLAFWLRGHALQVYVVDGGPTLELFSAGMETDDDLLLPMRMGLLLQASQGEPFTKHLGTYEYEEGVHLAMTTLFKSGSALMATWGDPYVTVIVSREAGLLRTAFGLTKTARSLELHCLGPGDMHTVAAAYRARAEALGYRVTWDEKLKTRPQAARLFGASNVKLWTALARRIDENLMEQAVDIHWTFDEAAQIAEHLKRDLGMDDVLFHLGGWTRYGYDCKHPDNMPANPECGGNEGLIDCARRVQALGYLFCLHDNYQDMYRDAPSWDEKWLQKEADGSPHLGGVWLGGRAYYTCAREALKLAQRPENLPLIQATFEPDLYFIDTTYAVGPQECYDPRHPLTKQDDIRWKQALSDYARDLFGMFGSECGREWAVPHADFFEGLASVGGRYYHFLELDKLGGKAVPFFDMVFRDCIAIQGKYGYKPEAMGEQVIHHVVMGRTLYYHALGKHLYWEHDSREELPFPDGVYDPAVFTRAHNGWAEGLCVWDRFMKNTHEVLSPLNKRTSQTLIARYDFLDEDRLVRKTTFGNGAVVWVNGSTEDVVVASGAWGDVVLPPYGFLVDTGGFVAFHARSWSGHIYDAPVLFTLTSLDGNPLSTAEQVRVFHGFGESALAWRGDVIDVRREDVLQG